MIRIAICDDIEKHLQAAARLIEEQAAAAGKRVMVEAFSSGEELLKAFGQWETPPEAAVLDIKLTGLDGITLAKRVNQLAPYCQIVFLTGYIDYVMDVYEADHVYMVLKERMAERLWPAIEKALEHHDCLTGRTMTVRIGVSTAVIHCAQILYLERVARKTCIYMTDGEVWTREGLDALAERSCSNTLLRCHQSFIVNLDQVRALESDTFILENGIRVPISRNQKKRAQERFWAHMNAAVIRR